MKNEAIYIRKSIKTVLCCSLVLGLCSCSFFMSKSVDRFGQGLSDAIANNDDPQTVSQALPAYLLFMDSLASQKNASPQTISNAAKLYAGYASLFAKDKKRKKRLATRALKYAEQSLCKLEEKYCSITSLSSADFINLLSGYENSLSEQVYVLGQVWALWIQSHSEDWNAVAQLAQVKWIMQSTLERDETLDDGGAHYVLGVINTLVPPAMGGKPELARKHFKKALLITDEKNLSIKVALAEHYARLIFNQELHDKLLKEVLLANPRQDGFVLVNVIAQEKARQLMKTSHEYF